MEDLEHLSKMCKEFGIRDEKECGNIVVERKTIRGGLCPSRLGGLVVRPVRSCLGRRTRVGMNDGSIGSGDLLKGVILMDYGEK